MPGKDKTKLVDSKALKAWKKEWGIEAADAALDLVGFFAEARADAEDSEELGQMLAAQVITLIDDDETEAASEALRGIHLLSKSPDASAEDQAAAQVAAKLLTERHQKEMRAEPASTAERETARMPSEVMVHLIAALKAERKAKPDSRTMKELEAKAKSLVMRHDLGLKETQKFLKVAAKACRERHYKRVAKVCESLAGQLPEKGSDLPATRLNDNIYGRAYDSALIGNLVEDPPRGVRTAMRATGGAFADMLDARKFSDDSDQFSQGGLDRAVEGLQEYLTSKDPRFWFNQVPGLEKVRDAKTPEKALAALSKFLRSKKSTGPECIAMPYLLVKFSILLAQQVPNPWMDKGDSNNRKVVVPQKGLDTFGDDSNLSVGAGITQRHQPAIVEEDWMEPGKRPTTVSRPEINKPGIDEDDDETKHPTEAVELALEHGLPWATGASGSTNIMLHMLEHLQDNGHDDIDTKDFLLGTMMFLVYDGGHSVNEVLWTANQLEPVLGLEIGLRDDEEEPEEFVADYEQFIGLYGDKGTGKALQEAAEGAWDKVTDYFDEHSHFAE